MLTQVNSQGNKNFTYDYANGMRLTKGQPGQWELPNPINSGTYAISYGSVIQRFKEFTPIGDSVATENPYLSGGDPTGNYPSFGDASTFKCAWDSVSIDCSSLNKFYISKNSMRVMTLLIEKRVGARTTATRAQLQPGGDRLGNVIYGSAGPGGETSVVEVLAEPDTFSITETFSVVNWVKLGTEVQVRRITETEKIPLRNFKKLLQDTLAYGKCADFLARVITEMGKRSGGRNDPISTDLMKVYALLNRQARGGIELNHTESTYYGYWGKGYKQLDAIAGGGGLSDGYWQLQNRKSWIHMMELRADAPMRDRLQVPFRYAERIVHELVHVAGQNDLYSHKIMDESALALEGLHFDAAVSKFCIPPS